MNVIEKLKEHASPTPSHWKEEAEYRLANKSWLRYSQKIALLMLDKMEQEGITEKQKGCSDGECPEGTNCE